MLLGLSGASFLVGLTLYSPYFYATSVALLGLGYLYTFKRQKDVCTVEEGRRNRWLFPILMAGIMGGSYLVLTEAVTPLLTPLASARLSPGMEGMLDMPGMDMGGPGGEGRRMDDKPVMYVADAAPMPAASVAGTIRRAELVIDRMT